MDSLGVDVLPVFFIQFDRIRGAMPPIRFVRRKRLPLPEPDIYRIEHERPCLVETRILVRSHALVLHTDQVTMPSRAKRRYC